MSSKKITIPDTNGNGKLDLFDVLAYYAGTGVNVLLLAINIFKSFSL